MHKLIIDSVRNSLRSAEQEYYKRKENHAVCVAKRDVWDSFNSTSNPYKPETWGRGVEASLKTLKQWQKAYDLVVETFLEES